MSGHIRRVFFSFKSHSRLTLPPRFAVGDAVRERFPSATSNREIGTVVTRYEFENQYRYVVKFVGGGEEVFFFEPELLPIDAVNERSVPSEG